MTKEQEMSLIPKQYFAFPTPGQTAWGTILINKGDKGVEIVTHFKINVSTRDSRENKIGVWVFVYLSLFLLGPV